MALIETSTHALYPIGRGDAVSIDEQQPFAASLLGAAVARCCGRDRRGGVNHGEVIEGLFA